MQQRVALARALVNLPKVLLLDEPLGALDLKLRKGLQLELKRIQREVGITFVYVTHDQEEALTMSDRIAVMNRGRIEQCAGPEDVYERPTTTFVAGFIGVSNLMPGEVTSANGAGPASGSTPGSRSRRRPTGCATGERCHAVVRPEKLQLDPEGRAGPRRLAERRGHGRELGLPRHLDPDRRPARRRRADDRPGPERRRGRARAPARRRRRRAASPGRPEHIHVVRESESPVAATQTAAAE